MSKLTATSYGIKSLFSDARMKNKNVEMRNVHKRDWVEIELATGYDVNVFVYLTSVVGNGKEEVVMLGRLIEDGEQALHELTSNNHALNEIERKWPQFFGMICAGSKDVYTDTAIITMYGDVWLATKFDMSRSGKADAFEYLSDKALHIMKQYLVIRGEIESNPLSTSSIKMKGVIDSVVEGYKGAKMANTIFNIMKIFT